MALKLTQNSTGKSWSSGSKKEETKEERKKSTGATAPVEEKYSSPSGKLTLTRTSTSTSIPADEPGLLERIGKTLSGTGRRQVSGYAGAAENLLENTKRLDMLNSSQNRKAQQEQENAANYRKMLERGTMDDGSVIDAEKRAWLEDALKRAEQRAGVYQRSNEAIHQPITGLIDKTDAYGDRVGAAADADLQRAKQGAGVVGRTLVDAGSALTDVLADAAANMILPGMGTVGRAARTYGHGAEAAEDKGLGLAQQNLYGAGSAALGELANRMFSSNPILQKAFGSGALDDILLPGLEKSLPGSIVKSGFGEAIEEGGENIADYFLQRAIMGDQADDFSWKDVGYDALIGGLVGGVTGVSRGRNGQNVQNQETDSPASQNPATDAAPARSLPPTEGNSMGQEETGAEGLKMASAAIEAKQQPLPSPTDRRTSVMETAKKTLGKEGYRMFEAAYRDSDDPATSYSELTRAYNEGLVGRKTGSHVLTAGQYESMFEAGRADAAANVAKQQAQAAKETTFSRKDSGIDYADAVTGAHVASVDQKTVKVLDNVAKALGVKVRFADSVEGGAANAQIQNGVITIEKGNPHPLRSLFGHEITHRMQDLAPAEYAKLRETVAESGWTNAYIQKEQAKYAQHGRTIGNEAALDEAVADYVGALMEDDGELERFIQKHGHERTLLEKLRDIVRELKVKLRGTEHEKQLLAVEKRLGQTLDAAVKQAKTNVDVNADVGVHVDAKTDSDEFDGVMIRRDEVVVKDPSQIKSADPVTYDDNGNVIPLSERFNPENNDIRFSLKDSDDLAREIVRIQKEGRTQKRSEADVQADIRKAVEEAYASMVDEYGAIDPGERAARDVQVPKKTGKGKKVSQTVRTAMEAAATPDEALPDIQKLIATGDFSYDVYTDKAAIADAASTIESAGWAQSLADWTDQVKRGIVSKTNTAMGWALYNNAVNSGDTKTALTVLENMVQHQRNAAQALQATRILKKLSPETQLYQIQRSVENLQQELNERYGDKKAPKIVIPQTLAEEYRSAQTQEERDEVMKDIYRDVGRQMPPRFIDKWNAWRYLAMLGNARTHVRNVVGNAGFAPIVAAKNLTATAIESAVSRVSGGKLNRTKSMVGASKADRALLKAAWADFAKVQDQVMGDGKYSDAANANKYIEEGQKVFKNRLLEAARRGNTKAMEAEDRWFSRPHYAAALASYCKQHGLTAEQIARGKETRNARLYAMKEAQKATYRDTNDFSQLISKIRFKNPQNGLEKAANAVMEGILPFRKTPANILVRGLEYSPMGLLNGIKQAVWDVRKGKKTGAEAIDSISAGLTGTGLLSLGLYLAAQGLIRGHGGDDDDQKEFEEMMGHQAYALEIGDKSYTLDWLAPEALPFFVGVNLWEQMEADQELTFRDALSAIGTVTEPLLEMSCLQSLNAVFETVGYASSNDMSGLTTALSSAATSYLTQALPTLLGQAERTSEETRMTTYTDKNGQLPNDWQYTLGKASSRLPGDYQQIPYIDAWGRTESSGSAGARAFNNFLNPAYTSEIQTSAMEEELLRLYEETGDGRVFPSRAAKYFSINGERKDLTAKEYVKYAQKQGQTAYTVLTSLTKSSAYRTLNDSSQVDAISKCYDYADAVAKMSVSSYKPKGWIADAIATSSATGLSADKYLTIYLNAQNIESLKHKVTGDTIDKSQSLRVMQMIYNTPGLNEMQRTALFETLVSSTSVRHYNKALVEQELAVMKAKAK